MKDAMIMADVWEPDIGVPERKVEVFPVSPSIEPDEPYKEKPAKAPAKAPA